MNHQPVYLLGRGRPVGETLIQMPAAGQDVPDRLSRHRHRCRHSGYWHAHFGVPTSRLPVAWLMDLGVDGIITDYPTRLRTLMDGRGVKLPRAYEPKG